ncbi:dipeptide epimerase [Lysinibacillus agricola]|uniref:Dipeptide epimerase n=1 Tax=Lysinibacillus agricola TaxID=2590012 RepID=A0ABX7AL46_9BACI|nr:MULTISPECIES: dipeptide epimerase [Lysinibacillus]KOS59812.1 hypothetical protein AN161_26175 [Lysinibacillus sp. FJAT-14222]QQP10587.1 dipeptide epimerase [Lysinibacillus agricola]
MQITNIQSKIYEPESIVNFKVALIERVIPQNVIIKITTDEGIIGYGEAAPFLPVTGSDAQETQHFIQKIATLLIGKDPFYLENIHNLMNQVVVGQNAAKAGIDMALYDIIGKSSGQPLYKLLGGNSNQIETDMTLGIDTPENMAKKAVEYTEMGFRILKVKTGINSIEDIHAIKLIREAVGPDIELRLDANQGWDAKETIRTMKALEKYNVLEVEQPVPYWNLAACCQIRESISQHLMLDESVHSPQDALRAIQTEAADMINIKLMKCGGIYQGIKINAISEVAGIPCMVGCMSESRLGIAAGAALVGAKSNIRASDLDSHYLIAESPHITGGFVQDGGLITIVDKPGLGVEVNFDAL